MASTRGQRSSTPSGTSLLELLAVLGLAAMLAGTAGLALARLARTTEIEAARARVVLALLEARRRAYLREATVVVEARAAATALVVDPGGDATGFALPRRTSVLRAPATGRVRFFASGLADNATVVIADEDGTEARIVVNQRGLIR